MRVTTIPNVFAKKSWHGHLAMYKNPCRIYKIYSLDRIRHIKKKSCCNHGLYCKLNQNYDYYTLSLECLSPVCQIKRGILR